MLSGISILCFAASYATALALEVSRLFFRSGVRGAIMLALAAAGLLAHTLYLVYRAATADSTPLSSEFDWYLVAAWTLVATYLYLTLYHPRTAVGLFVLPLVLVLIGVAQFFASQTPFPEQPASQVWGAIHGGFILLGTVAVMVGFVAGLMYLLQAWRLKRKQLPPPGFQLPNLEWLQRVNSRAIVISVIMLSAGFLSGTVLNMVNHRRQLDELPWTDPVVWSTGLLLAWMLAAVVFGTLYKPALQGRKVAYLTVASFVFLVFSISVRLLLPSQHSPPKSQSESSAKLGDSAAARAARPEERRAWCIGDDHAVGFAQGRATPTQPLTPHHSPLTPHHSPLTTHHSPLTTRHSSRGGPA